MPGKRSMSQIYLLSLVSMAILPALLLGYLWVSDQRQQFEDESRAWRESYIDMQQQTLRRRVFDLINSLEFERAEIDARQRTALRLAVDNAAAQLDSLRRYQAEGADRATLLRRARELLAPIRFGGGRDHYFITTSEGRVLLMPGYREHEGQPMAELVDANGDHFATRLSEMAQRVGEGYLEVWYSRPGAAANTYLTLQYARYYPALGIYLGAVGYVDDMVAAMQRDELSRLATTLDDIVVTIGDQHGNVIFDSYAPNNRENLFQRAESVNPGVSDAVRARFANPDGGVVTLRRARNDTGEPVPMLMYLREYPNWHWLIGAGYFLDKIDASIAQRRQELQHHISQRIAVGSLVLLALVVTALTIARRLALRTRDALRSFTTFFAEASRDSTAIDVEKLPYVEFEQLALDANRMIEQRNRIENTLRDSEQRFEKALDVANIHLWDADLCDAVLTLSGSLFAQLGYDNEARHIDFAEWSEWVHPDDIAAAQRVQALMVEGTEHFSVEFRLHARDGSYRWFLSRGGVVARDAYNRAQRALGTLTEITTRKQMEQDLIAARIAAEDANHAKSQFLSSISHELRTPLNGVLGYAQILLRDQTASAEQRHNLRAIESCGQHLLTLIDDVLDLAKIESGTIEIQRTACDLYDLLENVSNIVRERVDDKGLLYVLDIDHAVPASVLVDEVKLRQILVNLLGNAVKFTRAGGITLKVALRSDSELQFQVCDTGIGIPLSKQREIFEPFQQLATANGGTGLGLPISQRLCEAMGGTLTVKSAPGAGSCFAFNLPFERSTALRTVSSPRAMYQVIDTGADTVTVMVVDDNPVNRQVLSGMLRASGVDVVEAEHGLDALDKLRARPLPLVLMDVRMPTMDGYAATAAIKSDPALRDTVVIAVSASVFPEVVARMRAQGCDDFVSKPVRVGELLTKVAQHLRLPLRNVEIASATMTVATDARLPEPLIAELRAAVALGDVEAMRAALVPLRSAGPELLAMAQHVERMLDNFDIDAVRDLLAPDNASA
jgi:PAS domain S-box-containing protein